MAEGGHRPFFSIVALAQPSEASAAIVADCQKVVDDYNKCWGDALSFDRAKSGAEAIAVGGKCFLAAKAGKLAPLSCGGFGSALAETGKGMSCLYKDHPINATCLGKDCYWGFCSYAYTSLFKAQCQTAFSGPEKYVCNRKNHEVCDPNGNCEVWQLTSVPDTVSDFWQAPAPITGANYGDVSAAYTGHPVYPVTMYVLENGVYEPACSTAEGCATVNACLVEQTYSGFCSPFGYNWYTYETQTTGYNTWCGNAQGLAERGPYAKYFSTGTSPLVWTDVYGLLCGCGSDLGCPGWGPYGDSYYYMVELEDANLVRTERRCFSWSCQPNCCTDGSGGGCNTPLPCNPDVPPDSSFGRDP